MTAICCLLIVHRGQASIFQDMLIAPVCSFFVCSWIHSYQMKASPDVIRHKLYGLFASSS